MQSTPDEMDEMDEIIYEEIRRDMKILSRYLCSAVEYDTAHPTL